MKSSERVVVVVEDDEAVRELLVLLLEQEGFSVFPMPDGEAGAEAVRTTRPHLIILDLCLPGLSGLDLLRELKADSRTAQVPVLVLSAYTEWFDRAVRLRAEAVCEKPFDLDKIIHHVQHLTAVA